IEAADRPQDVDAFEVVGTVLLEQRRLLDGVLVGSRRTEGISRAGIPGCRRIRVVVGNLAVANDDVMREHAADRLVKAATNRLFWDLEFAPGLRAAGMDLFQSLLKEIESRGGCVGLEIRAGPIALDRIVPFRNVPLELRLVQAPGSWK